MKTARVWGVLLFVGSVVTVTAFRASGAPEGDDPSPVIVTVSDVHICCGGCVKAIAKAAQVDGVQAEVDQDEATVVLTAATYKDIQKSLEKIAKAGFCGKIEDDTQAGKVNFPEIKLADGKVKKLSVKHVHNCCRGCSDALVEAVEGVEGVSSHTVKPKAVAFVVEGNFDPSEVVQALEEAGFYPQVE